MWAEMATNYYANSIHPDLLRQVFATDAGYIPLPQRILAFTFSALPASSVPYAYTWAATLATGLLVGSFSHPVFRRVMESDVTRVFVCLAVLMVADFESRTFINFTYFVAFFATVLSAQAISTRGVGIPPWAWILPVLMISKPHTLVALPILLVGALAANGRLRKIVICTLVFVFLQAIELLISNERGVMALQAKTGTLDRAQAIAGYFFGLLGQYAAGPSAAKLIPQAASVWIFIGIAFFGITVYFSWVSKRPSSWLILAGLSLIFFDVLLNCVALSVWWNSNLSLLSGINIHRYTLSAFYGVVLATAGLCDLVACALVSKGYSRLSSSGAIIFTCWFLLAGWHSYGMRISRAPGSPVTGNSQWQAFSPGLDQGTSDSICIPIDPFGWVYGSNCRNLTNELGWTTPHRFHLIGNSESDSASIQLDVPRIDIAGSQIAGLLSLARTTGPKMEQISARAIITLKGGRKITYRGANEILPTGTAILLFGPPANADDIESVELQFDRPVSIAMHGPQNSEIPMTVWLGH